MNVKTLIVAATALTLSAAAGLAQSDMNIFFANTLVMTSAEGAEFKLHINENGTYHGIAPDGSEFTGTWEQNDAGEACFTRKQPAELPPVCNALNGAAVGDTWESTMADGTAVTVTLAEGR
jgi:hypothetical protein